MELPDEIVKIIREYSRPQMQFVNEWAAAHRAIKENNVVYAPKFHADVKAKLFTSEAAQYMEIFEPYIAAAVATRRFTLVRDRIPLGRNMTPEDCAEVEFWRDRTREAMDERHRLQKLLFLMLYGPPEPWPNDE